MSRPPAPVCQIRKLPERCKHSSHANESCNVRSTKSTAFFHMYGKRWKRNIDWRVLGSSVASTCASKDFRLVRRESHINNYALTSTSCIFRTSCSLSQLLWSSTPLMCWFFFALNALYFLIANQAAAINNPSPRNAPTAIPAVAIPPSLLS